MRVDHWVFPGTPDRSGDMAFQIWLGNLKVPTMVVAVPTAVALWDMDLLHRSQYPICRVVPTDEDRPLDGLIWGGRSQDMTIRVWLVDPEVQGATMAVIPGPVELHRMDWHRRVPC